jgi:hypothetical protein
VTLAAWDEHVAPTDHRRNFSPDDQVRDYSVINRHVPGIGQGLEELAQILHQRRKILGRWWYKVSTTRVVVVSADPILGPTQLSANSGVLVAFISS